MGCGWDVESRMRPVSGFFTDWFVGPGVPGTRRGPGRGWSARDRLSEPVLTTAPPGADGSALTAESVMLTG